jgi:hypothetical protein
MNTEGVDRMDGVDLLIKVAIFGCFVIFGMSIWLIKRQRNSRRSGEGPNDKPPRIPNG